MISGAQAAAFLPPIFQIPTGLCLTLLLVIRFAGGKALRPLWGKLTAFAVAAMLATTGLVIAARRAD